MSLDDLIEGLARFKKRFVRKLYKLHLELMDNPKFENMGILHPDPRRRQQFIKNSRLSDDFDRAMPIEFADIYSALVYCLNNIIVENLITNKLPEEVIRQLLSLSNKAERKEISEAEAISYLSGKKVIGTLSMGCHRTNEYYNRLYIDPLTRTICLNPEQIKTSTSS